MHAVLSGVWLMTRAFALAPSPFRDHIALLCTRMGVHNVFIACQYPLQHTSYCYQTGRHCLTESQRKSPFFPFPLTGKFSAVINLIGKRTFCCGPRVCHSTGSQVCWVDHLWRVHSLCSMATRINSIYKYKTDIKSVTDFSEEEKKSRTKTENMKDFKCKLCFGTSRRRD